MENVNNTGKCKLTVSIVAIVATFLLMAFLVKQMADRLQPAPLGADRSVARARDNADIRAAGADALRNWGYVDQPRGVVRVPVEEAMKLTVQGYQKPADFRSNLVVRVEKATAPGPKPPEKKSEYE